MGSCISKCSKPKKNKFIEDCSNNIHDKLVISQDPISSLPPDITKIPSQKPLISPTPSFSSISCSTTTASSTTSTTTSSSSSSSCSSSLLTTAKESSDQSFSNEFLRSCVRDNPHVIGLINSPPIKVKEKSTTTSGNKIHPQNLDARVNDQEKNRIMIRVSSSPKKRARANSPTLVVRQKSLRRDHINSSFSDSASSVPNRGLLRSPSPGRRLSNGHDNNVRGFAINGNNNSVNYGVKRESFRGSKASPNRDMTISNRNFSVKKNDSISRKIGAKMDVIGHHHGQELMDDVVMDDINNPLIALDCFIFL